MVFQGPRGAGPSPPGCALGGPWAPRAAVAALQAVSISAGYLRCASDPPPARSGRASGVSCPDTVSCDTAQGARWTGQASGGGENFVWISLVLQLCEVRLVLTSVFFVFGEIRL